MVDKTHLDFFSHLPPLHSKGMTLAEAVPFLVPDRVSDFVSPVGSMVSPLAGDPTSPQEGRSKDRLLIFHISNGQTYLPQPLPKPVFHLEQWLCQGQQKVLQSLRREVLLLEEFVFLAFVPNVLLESTFPGLFGLSKRVRTFVIQHVSVLGMCFLFHCLYHRSKVSLVCTDLGARMGVAGALSLLPLSLALHANMELELVEVVRRWLPPGREQRRACLEKLRKLLAVHGGLLEEDAARLLPLALETTPSSEPALNVLYNKVHVPFQRYLHALASRAMWVGKPSAEERVTRMQEGLLKSASLALFEPLIRNRYFAAVVGQGFSVLLGSAVFAAFFWKEGSIYGYSLPAPPKHRNVSDSTWKLSNLFVSKREFSVFLSYLEASWLLRQHAPTRTPSDAAFESVSLHWERLIREARAWDEAKRTLKDNLDAHFRLSFSLHGGFPRGVSLPDGALSWDRYQDPARENAARHTACEGDLDSQRLTWPLAYVVERGVWRPETALEGDFSASWRKRVLGLSDSLPPGGGPNDGSQRRHFKDLLFKHMKTPVGFLDLLGRSLAETYALAAERGPNDIPLANLTEWASTHFLGGGAQTSFTSSRRREKYAPVRGVSEGDLTSEDLDVSLLLTFGVVRADPEHPVPLVFCKGFPGTSLSSPPRSAAGGGGGEGIVGNSWYEEHGGISRDFYLSSPVVVVGMRKTQALLEATSRVFFLPNDPDFLATPMKVVAEVHHLHSFGFIYQYKVEVGPPAWGGVKSLSLQSVFLLQNDTRMLPPPFAKEMGPGSRDAEDDAEDVLKTDVGVMRRVALDTALAGNPWMGATGGLGGRLDNERMSSLVSEAGEEKKEVTSTTGLGRTLGYTAGGALLGAGVAGISGGKVATGALVGGGVGLVTGLLSQPSCHHGKGKHAPWLTSRTRADAQTIIKRVDPHIPKSSQGEEEEE